MKNRIATAVMIIAAACLLSGCAGSGQELRPIYDYGAIAYAGHPALNVR